MAGVVNEAVFDPAESVLVLVVREADIGIFPRGDMLTVVVTNLNAGIEIACDEGQALWRPT